MRNVYFTIMAAFIMCGTCVGCSAETAQQGGSKEVALVLVKGVAGQAQGKLVIDTANGTDLAIRISGLDPKGLYTAFFVNTKSKMFEGIGPAPHVLTVSETGEVDFKTTMKKDIYKRFVQVGIYLNPSGKPIGNPVGVKAKLGALIKKETPKPILMGNLRQDQ